MNILVSGCLLGMRVRYDGKSKPHEDVLRLMERHTLIPVCAEVFGGLPTPRIPAERVGDQVITQDGRDVTGEYRRGAEEIARLCKMYRCTLAILKEKSPSCGRGFIYDGTYSGTLTEGNGVLAETLLKMGVRVVGESEIEDLLARGEL